MYKVRFHLGRGKHYQHWQIKDKDNNSIYVDPNKATILLKECRLHNQPNASKKILSGENKRPCAWVVCKEYIILCHALSVPKEYCLWELAFNPRKSWHWRLIDHDYNPAQLMSYNLDNLKLDSITSNGRQLYAQYSEILEFIKKAKKPTSLELF